MTVRLSLTSFVNDNSRQPRLVHPCKTASFNMPVACINSETNLGVESFLWLSSGNTIDKAVVSRLIYRTLCQEYGHFQINGKNRTSCAATFVISSQQSKRSLVMLNPSSHSLPPTIVVPSCSSMNASTLLL